MNVLVTAGPTREPIDAVRFISNRSSGAMGVAIADAAVAAGHRVTLLLGQGVSEPAPHDRLTVHRFSSTADLESRLNEHFPSCDALVMAAAVADYRPVRVAPGKRLRDADASARWTLELEPTPDLVAAIGAHKRRDQVVIAFALEDPASLEQRATAKLRRKHADAIVANPLDTMDASDIDGVWRTATGERERPGAMSKDAFARWLVERIDALRQAR